MRRSVTKPMRHDWRPLSRDNIIISYGHANKGADETRSTCESVEEGRESGRRGVRNLESGVRQTATDHNELAGAPLFVCQTIDLTAMKTTSDNRTDSFWRPERKDDDTLTRTPIIERSFRVNRSKPTVSYKSRMMN